MYHGIKPDADGYTQQRNTSRLPGVAVKAALQTQRYLVHFP